MHRSRSLYAVLVLGLVVLAAPAFADQTPDASVATPADLGQEAAPLEINLDFGTPEASPVSTSTWHFSHREFCYDTHYQSPCWTVQYSQPGCPSAQPEGMACTPGSEMCVGNIQYHTYDLFSCY